MSFLLLGDSTLSLIFGEDYDLHNRIIQRHEIGRIDAKEMHLGEYKSLFEIAQKNYYYGKSADKFLSKNKLRGVRQVNPFRSTYFRNLRKFWQNPVLTFGFIIYQIVRYSAGALGLLTILIVNLLKPNKKLG